MIATSVATVVVDKPPCAAADDAYSTTVDTPLTVGAPGVLGNDFQCPDFTGLQVDQPPTDGTVTLQADGSFTYTPNPGFVGQDTFTYDHLGFDIITFDDIVLANATVVIDVTATPATTEPGRRNHRTRRHHDDDHDDPAGHDDDTARGHDDHRARARRRPPKPPRRPPRPPRHRRPRRRRHRSAPCGWPPSTPR